MSISTSYQDPQLTSPVIKCGSGTFPVNGYSNGKIIGGFSIARLPEGILMQMGIYLTPKVWYVGNPDNLNDLKDWVRMSS